MTQFEPIAARKSFPCFDEPAFKTPWDLTLVVPADARRGREHPVRREEACGDGRRECVFATTEPLPTYLIAYAVGPWDVVEAPPIPATPERSRAAPAARHRGRTDAAAELRYALAETPRIVSALESWFGLAYPFDKLDLLAAPDFAFGAMENAGLIIYQERLLLVDRDLAHRAAPGLLRRSTLHELAHQWFGNLVTMPWWDDLWLNEAFATWLATKLTAQLEPEYRVELRALEARARCDGRGQPRDRAPHRRADRRLPRRDRAPSTASPTRRARAVLAMFEAYLGAERFQGALRAHLRRFRARQRHERRPDATRSPRRRTTPPPSGAPSAASWTSRAPRGSTSRSPASGEPPALRIVQQRDLPLGSKRLSRRSAGACRSASGSARRSGATKHCALVEASPAEVAPAAGRVPGLADAQRGRRRLPPLHAAGGGPRCARSGLRRAGRSRAADGGGRARRRASGRGGSAPRSSSRPCRVSPRAAAGRPRACRSTHSSGCASSWRTRPANGARRRSREASTGRASPRSPRRTAR